MTRNVLLRKSKSSDQRVEESQGPCYVLCGCLTHHFKLVLEWRDRPETQALRDRLDALTTEEKAATIISYEEQVRGWLAYLAKSGP